MVYRVGALIPIRWSEFSNHGGVNTVRAYYRIGAGSLVFIDNIDNSYSSAIDANADGLNRHAGTITAVSGMVGSTVTLLIRDSTEDDIEAVATQEPHTICTDAATTMHVSPSYASVRPSNTRTFSAIFYAADGLTTDNHDASSWSVDGGGSIGSSSGIFTAGESTGGPWTVTGTAGSLNDTAVVRISNATISGNAVSHLGLPTLSLSL